MAEAQPILSKPAKTTHMKCRFVGTMGNPNCTSYLNLDGKQYDTGRLPKDVQDKITQSVIALAGIDDPREALRNARELIEALALDLTNASKGFGIGNLGTMAALASEALTCLTPKSRKPCKNTLKHEVQDHGSVVISSEIAADLETLRATIRGCDEALAADLEAWERKEYQQVREKAVTDLASREAAIASLGMLKA